MDGLLIWESTGCNQLNFGKFDRDTNMTSKVKKLVEVKTRRIASRTYEILGKTWFMPW